jgi:outer membrane receptor protein involved in Fe transport
MFPALPALAAEQAAAQAPAPSAVLEEIVVSGSRIRREGYTAPTPVTVVNADVLERDAPINVADTLRQIPAFGRSSSPENTVGGQSISGGNAGTNVVNLRELGVDRTLVLFDGHRVVSSGVGSGVDMNLMPAALVARVDVVTGGASAAWGSDAVAGVVNVILNKRFTGFQANLQGGVTVYGDVQQYKAEASYGRGFASGRGHLLGSVSYVKSPDEVYTRDRARAVPFYNTRIVNNPAYTPTNGQPRQITAPLVGYSQATQGGLINAGPLRGIQFVGPNGTPIPFNFGNVSGGLCSSCDLVDDVGEHYQLTQPHEDLNLFGYASWALADNLNVSLELNWGRNDASNQSISYTRFGGAANVIVRNDNAFLPQSVKAQMAAVGLTTISVGTTNTNLGFIANDLERTTKRAVLAFNGSFGGWDWDLHASTGQYLRYTLPSLLPHIASYNMAVDAVVAPAGIPGIPAGAIVCRSTLTAPTDGCKPLNIFGNGVATPEAIAYVNRGNPFARNLQELKEVAFSTQGELFDLWGAGPIAVAVGAEYREEGAKQDSDAGSLTRQFAAGNFNQYNLDMNVKEVFGEVDIPLLRGVPLAQALDFNAAVRYTDYSASGTVWTWKTGVTDTVTDELRLRGTISRDIRAPNLTELFNPGSSSQSQFFDPQIGTSVTAFNFNGGNPNLKPEKADTVSAGAIVTPRWLPGFIASVDYYSIDIEGAIVGTNARTTLERCFAGETVYCPLIIRNAAGQLLQVNNSPANASTVRTSGLDFQATYRRDLGPGRITFNLAGNYTFETVRVAEGRTLDYVGSLGLDAPVSGALQFKTTFTATYDQGPLSGTVQARILGPGKVNNEWVEGVDIDDNHVPGTIYFDLRGSYNLTDNIEVFGAVDNILNRKPELIPMSASTGQLGYFASFRGDLHDVLGTRFRAGIRLKY